MADEIRQALQSAFAPETLEVINESHRHAGHSGDDGSGESHWRVEMDAAALKGLSRVEKHRRVHAALGDITGRIHALQLKLG